MHHQIPHIECLVLDPQDCEGRGIHLSCSEIGDQDRGYPEEKVSVEATLAIHTLSLADFQRRDVDGTVVYGDCAATSDEGHIATRPKEAFEVGAGEPCLPLTTRVYLRNKEC